jgi:hypothetical protein
VYFAQSTACPDSRMSTSTPPSRPHFYKFPRFTHINPTPILSQPLLYSSKSPAYSSINQSNGEMAEVRNIHIPLLPLQNR